MVVKKDALFFQLFESESSTYTYVLMDENSKETVIIDPVLEMAERDLQLLMELGAKLKFILETHVHADHVTAAHVLRQKTGAKTAIGAKAEVESVDVELREGDEVAFGSHRLRVLETPGHTEACLSFVFGDRVFTGDALLIRGTGRTDFQSGSSEILYHSIRDKLFSLPEDTRVYPGHDYKGRTSSTIGLEKKFNPRVGDGKSLSEFSRIMSGLGLAEPKKIHVAVPANKKGGRIKG